MIIFMSGYPFSGKTTFVNLLLPKLPDIKSNHIDLKDWFLPEYDELSENEKKNNGITAWEFSLEALDKAIRDSDDYCLIVYDTAAASLETMLEKFKDAKWYKKQHHVFYVFVSATPEECRARAGKRWVGKSAIEYYSKRFKNTIPRLKKESDEFIVVDNHDSIESLGEYVDALASRIMTHVRNNKDGQGRIHKSQ